MSVDMSGAATHNITAYELTLHRCQSEWIDLSHETLLVDPLRSDQDFEMTQHLVTDLTPIPASGSWS